MPTPQEPTGSPQRSEQFMETKQGPTVQRRLPTPMRTPTFLPSLATATGLKSNLALYLTETERLEALQSHLDAFAVSMAQCLRSMEVRTSTGRQPSIMRIGNKEL